MTVIRPNSISGITSITAQANEINVFRSNGLIAGLNLNGVNFNTTAGISTLAALKITGNLDVAGVLTYQDVTNVDSVGIITARSTIDAQGDVSIADKIVHTGDTNTTIRFPAADTITAETAGSERLRITSTGQIRIDQATSPNNGIRMRPSGWNYDFRMGAVSSSGGSIWLAQNYEPTGGTRDSAAYGTNYIQFTTGGNIHFGTGATNTNPTERLRITSDGILQISTTKASGYVAEFNQLSTSNSAQIKINSPTDNNSRPCLIDFTRAGSIKWSAGMGYNDAYSGFHICSGASLSSGIANSKFVVTSDGYTGIGNYAGAGTDPVTSLLHVATNWNNGDVPMVHFKGANNEAPSSGSTNISFQITDENDNLIHKVWNTGGGNADVGNVYYAGNLGINSTAPTSKLDVVGDAKISGVVTKPNQPCAVVYQCTGPAGGAADASSDNGEPLHFDHVSINQGGMTISNNNARIQVPVAGIYFVSFMVSGTVTNVDLNDGIELILLKNGSEYPAVNSGAEPVFNFGAAANQEEFFCNNTLLVSLTAGDYLEAAVTNIGSSDGNINRGNFSVMLMA